MTLIEQVSTLWFLTRPAFVSKTRHLMLQSGGTHQDGRREH
jgi:hypothetical protein